MNGKSANGSLGGMACIEGLPPLPKSLSGLLNSSGGSWREMERMYVKKTMIQDDLSRGRNNTDSLLAHKPANLDAALALLRKEMVMVTFYLKKTRSVATLFGDKEPPPLPELFNPRARFQTSLWKSGFTARFDAFVPYFKTRVTKLDDDARSYASWRRLNTFQVWLTQPTCSFYSCFYSLSKFL